MNATQRRERARKGGLGLVKAHGVEHMSAIGCKGAQVFYTRYYWTPAGTSQFALIRKSDHAVIAFSDGSPVTRRETEAVR